MKFALLLLIILLLIAGCTTSKEERFEDICSEHRAELYDYTAPVFLQTHYTIYCLKENESLVFTVERDGTYTLKQSTKEVKN